MASIQFLASALSTKRLFINGIVSGVLLSSSLCAFAAPISEAKGHIVLQNSAFNAVGLNIDDLMQGDDVTTLSIGNMLNGTAPGTFDPNSTDPRELKVLFPASPYTNPQRRLAPLTSFSSTASDTASVESTLSGELSFAGVTRWRISPQLGGGNLLIGDFTLRFNAALSRWEISNNIDFPGVVFSVGDSALNQQDHTLTLTGNLLGDTFLDSMVPGAAGQQLGSLNASITLREDGTVSDAHMDIQFALDRWAALGLVTLDNMLASDAVSLPVGPVEGDDLLDVEPNDAFDAQAVHQFPLLTPQTPYTPDARHHTPLTLFNSVTTSESAFLQESVGHISFAGVLRLSGTLSNLLLGDFTLERHVATGSWHLVNHVSFRAVAFDIDNPSVTLADNGAFTLTGELLGSSTLASLVPNSEGQSFGTISVTSGDFPATPAPNPTPTPNPIPTQPSSGGSSGSLYWFTLLGLVLAGMRRRVNVN